MLRRLELRRIASGLLGRGLHSLVNAGKSPGPQGGEKAGLLRRCRAGTGVGFLSGEGFASRSFPLCGADGSGYVYLDTLTGEGIFLPGMQSQEIEASSVKKKRKKKMNKHKQKKLRRRDRNSTKKNK